MYYSYINIKLFWKLCYCFIICLLYRLSLYIIDKLYKPFDKFDKSNRLVFFSFINNLPIKSYTSTSISNLVSIVIKFLVGLGKTTIPNAEISSIAVGHPN